MEFRCGDEIIRVFPNTVHKYLGDGTEGIVYKYKNKALKIYYPEAINDGFGSKEKNHLYLTNIQTKQIILPNSLFYNVINDYSGYITEYQEDPNRGEVNTNIINSTSRNFIKNLRIVENDINTLSKNFVLMADVKKQNVIYNGTLYIIDPGRYRVKTNYIGLVDQLIDLVNSTDSDFNKILNKLQGTKKSSVLVDAIMKMMELSEENDINFKKLVESLIYEDMVAYGNSSRKSLKFIDRMHQESMGMAYSEYFEEELRKYDKVNEYIKHKH